MKLGLFKGIDSLIRYLMSMYGINCKKIEKEDIIRFFNQRASAWDSSLIKDDEKIGTILDNAEVRENSIVLDVACGTGFLIPYYLERNVKQITAIDISEEMVRVAREKCTDPRVTFIADDVETADFQEKFDAVVVYDAFPHFPDPENLIRKLASLLKENGILTIAHSMSREAINQIHHEGAQKVSLGLMEAEELGRMFSEYLKTEKVISNDRMYQVTGRKI